jgi:asparagine synthase (glutamine-hydrolysing)
MCGIAGMAFRDPARPSDPATLRRMADILRHRGPDGDGFHAAPGIGLAFRRLAIIDLATGEQPIANEDGTVVVVCNGEIYNHVELRTRLAAAGHRFRTASDVETIVHLYEEHGDRFVDHLRGMFAIALWDAPRRRLLLARDRFGIKPLYYAVTDGALVFGSEQKAILASGAVTPEPDLQGMRQLLTHSRTVTPRTIVRGIGKLAPGCMLAWSCGSMATSRYWDVSFPARDAYETRPDREWAEGLREKLAESVRLHLRSDVPVGAWLSGGIDSSSVVALMASTVADPVKTFTMRTEDPAFDELHGKRALDDFPAFRLDGHRVPCGPEDFELLPAAIWHTEGQVLGSIATGQLRVARASAEHVKVVMCGEGADEMLGGYSWYPTLPLLEPLFMLPRAARQWIARLSPVRRRWPGAAGTIAGRREMDFERYSSSISHLATQSAAARLFSAEVLDALSRDAPSPEAPSPPPGFDAWHPFARMQYFDIRHRLGDGVVLNLDATTMAHSVEARVPFLDHELAAFCARIPPRVKMRHLREKYVLRRAMESTLPPEITWRRKSPMRAPYDPWGGNVLPAFAREELSEARLREAGYFDAGKVSAALRLHRGGGENLEHALSAVLGVQLWDRMFRRGRLDLVRP